MSQPHSQIGIVNVTHGRNFRVVEPVNLYECTFGDDVFVGPFVEVTQGVVVGNRVKIQSHSFLCDGVTIGDDVFIGHGVMFTNDRFKTGGPARGDRSLYEQTRVGNNVSIGSGAVILPVSIADGCVIGAGAVVTRNCLVRGVYSGIPAFLARELTPSIER